MTTAYVAVAIDERYGPTQDLKEADERVALLNAARAIVSFHKPTPDGFCQGCLDQWARLAPVRCEQARWAVLVIETHGVDLWDQPTPS